MKKKALFMGAALICSAFSAFAYNENELMLGTDGKIRYNTDSSELEYSNDAGITWAAIGSGGGGNVTGSVVKVDGTALSTANFVDSSDINATASGSSVTLALTTTASNNIAKGVTAYGWGNHSAAGYLTDAPIDGTQYARKDGNWTTVSVVSVETDPVYANSTAHGIGAGNITRWDSALQNETDTLQTVTARGNNTTYGINVASIDVSGKSVTESLQVTTGAANGYVLTSDSGGNATWQKATGGGGVSSQWTNTTGGIYYSSGNVGVGTTAPTTALDVAGTVTATAFAGNGAGLTGISAGAWTVSGNDQYSSNSGNIGIGSTAPAAKLDVVGTATVDCLNINSAYTFPTADGAGNQFLQTNGSGTISWATAAGGSSTFVACINLGVLSSKYASGVDVALLRFPFNVTITRVYFTHDIDPTTELNANLKYADARIGLANAVVINDLDTTEGVRDDSTITSGSVAAGKLIYMEFDAAPDTAASEGFLVIEGTK